jgi:hypothetical protein
MLSGCLTSASNSSTIWGEPNGSVLLNRVPKRDRGSISVTGPAARCTKVMIMSGERVIFAALDGPGGPPRLKAQKRRGRE